MSNIKQVIVMRKDLNMRKGKIAAQAAHSTMKVLLEKSFKSVGIDGMICHSLCYAKDCSWDLWLNGIFTKICVSVNSEQELIDVYEKAIAAGLPAAIIEDNGLTEFHGVKTKTCCAIGPAKKEEIDPITGHLSLF